MINGKKVMGLTLARGGSKRVPRKNVIDVNGKPLIQYTIDEVKKSKYIDHYIISTDDEDIKKLCRELEQTYFDRSPAEDTQKSSDGLLEVLNSMDKPDYIVEIMCTNPLKSVEDIDGVIKKLDIMGVDSVCSVVRVWDYHPSRVKFIEGNKMKSQFKITLPEKAHRSLLFLMENFLENTASSMSM